MRWLLQSLLTVGVQLTLSFHSDLNWLLCSFGFYHVKADLHWNCWTLFLSHSDFVSNHESKVLRNERHESSNQHNYIHSSLHKTFESTISFIDFLNELVIIQSVELIWKYHLIHWFVEFINNTSVNVLDCI